MPDSKKTTGSRNPYTPDSKKTLFSSFPHLTDEIGLSSWGMKPAVVQVIRERCVAVHSALCVLVCGVPCGFAGSNPKVSF